MKLSRHGIASLLIESRGAMIAPVLAGVLCRVVVVTLFFDWAEAPKRYDDADYARISQAVLSTGAIPSHHFPVGYPLTLALMLGLSSGSFAVVRAVQVLAGSLAVAVVYLIARRLYDRQSAAVAAWCTALYPPLVYMTGRIMSETIFILLVLLSLLLWIQWDRNRGPARSVLAGGVFGLACLFRSNLLPLALIAPVWQAGSSSSRRKGTARDALLGAAAVALVLTLPGVYFALTRDEFVPLPTNAGKTFYGANNPLADGGWISVDEHPELLAPLPPDARTSAAVYNRALYQLGFKWISEDPAGFLRLLPHKLANAWIPGMQRSMVTSTSGGAATLLLVSYGALLLLGLAGLLAIRPRQGRDGLLIWVLLVYTGMSLVFYGNPRMGLFCAPVLAIYAAALATNAFHAVNRRLQRAGRAT